MKLHSITSQNANTDSGRPKAIPKSYYPIYPTHYQSCYCRLTWRLIFPLPVAAAGTGYRGNIVEGGRGFNV
jgi:hypothetical protein